MILDSLGMFDAAAAAPERMNIAIAQTKAVLAKADLPPHDEIANVVLAGVGTSGHAGSLVLEAVGPTIAVPLVVHRGYGVPHFVDESTLVIAMSFTGNTAEVIDAVNEAVDDGATVVCIGGDGELAAIAQRENLTSINVPEAPAARAAIDSLLVPALLTLDHLGFYPGGDEWIRLAQQQVEQRRNALIAENNPARALARRIGRALPIIYGGNGPGGAVSSFWKSQFNTNAKVAAFANQVPELTHNEIVGWGTNGDVTRQVFQAILLRHEFEHPSVAARIDLVEEILVEVVGEVYSVEAQGEGLLAQMMDLLLFGTFVSLNVAVETDVDPGPIAIVDEIAERIGES